MEDIRNDFPFLKRKIAGREIVYFDNAATTQKPKMVIDAIVKYYTHHNSNVHRGAHTVSREATEIFENSRKAVATFIGAEHEHEIIFTKGTTDSINLVAQSFCQKYLKQGDEIIVGAFEHHSNLVPWQIACEKVGASVKIIPVDANHELDISAFEKLLNQRVKIVAVNHISNALGNRNPIEKIISLSHSFNIPVLIDGAQSATHLPIDVKKMDIDFFTFSAHKMYGPTGMGVLYGKEKYLNAMPPYQSGGEMIKHVAYEKTTYNELPFKFEAGTPNIEGALGLQKAVEFVSSIGYEAIQKQEKQLYDYMAKRLQEVEGTKIIGSKKNVSSLVSFIVEGTHPYDVGTLLDQMGIAVRTGHHCVQPIMDFFGISGTIRASFALYNTIEEIDYTIDCLKKVVSMLR